MLFVEFFTEMHKNEGTDRRVFFWGYLTKVYRTLRKYV